MNLFENRTNRLFDSSLKFIDICVSDAKLRWQVTFDVCRCSFRWIVFKNYMSGLTSTESTESIEKYLKPNDNTTDSEHCSNDTIYFKWKSTELKINLLCCQSTYHSQLSKFCPSLKDKKCRNWKILKRLMLKRIYRTWKFCIWKRYLVLRNKNKYLSSAFSTIPSHQRGS